jgi:transposase
MTRERKYDYNLIMELAKKHSIPKVAELTGYNKHSVRDIVARHSKKRKKFYWTDEERIELKKLVKEGKSFKEISTILKRTEQSIHNEIYKKK